MPDGVGLARQVSVALLLGLYGLLWAGGVVAYLFLGGPPAHVAWTAPAFLATAAVLTLAWSPLSDWPLLALCAALGLGAEMLGVAFGVPFGRYVYTEALFPRAFGVPLVMGAAWLVLFAFVKQMRLPPWMGAVVMTAIDLVIDPLATRALGYWTWEAPGIYYGIPASNFAGWFLVSLLLFTLARRPLALRPRVFWLGWSVLLFFAVIALGVGLVLPGLIGVALLALSRHWRPSRAGRSERSIAPAPPGSPGR